MENYATAPGASMHMREDPHLTVLLENLILGVPITVAIETGTYLGLGSTRFVAEAFRRLNVPHTFHTIEVNYEHAMTARENLKMYMDVVQHWGCSVNSELAIEWMNQDAALLNHEQIHGVWADHMSEPAKHYAVEVRGSNPAVRSDVPARRWEGENLLPRLLAQHRAEKPLVILDSAGGIGLMEFMTVCTTMAGRDFSLLLDDTKHVKHYRSVEIMRANPDRFAFIGEGDSWVLARHKESVQ